jgi:hypothetical protein
VTEKDDLAATDREFAADPRRLAFRIPLSLLAVGALGAGAVLLVRLIVGPSHAWGNAAQAASRVLPICAALYSYIRFVYIARTTLVINTRGVVLRQPLATRHAAWGEIIRVEEAGPLTPTHRGGFPVAARLTMQHEPTMNIPDIFAMRRGPLARKLEAAHRANTGSPGASRPLL